MLADLDPKKGGVSKKPSLESMVKDLENQARAGTLTKEKVTSKVMSPEEIEARKEIEALKGELTTQLEKLNQEHQENEADRFKYLEVHINDLNKPEVVEHVESLNRRFRIFRNQIKGLEEKLKKLS